MVALNHHVTGENFGQSDLGAGNGTNSKTKDEGKQKTREEFHGAPHEFKKLHFCVQQKRQIIDPRKLTNGAGLRLPLQDGGSFAEATEPVTATFCPVLRSLFLSACASALVCSKALGGFPGG
jgi:hypothetical protein